WNQDAEIKALLAEAQEGSAPNGEPYSKKHAASLYARSFDRQALASKRLQYEKLDQLTVDILLGVR
ncbi:MAG TPA: xylose isomerase, partial [Blastocatellia bacterium]|nr:xylose isomerase [Blastocatellia bacterium]